MTTSQRSGCPTLVLASSSPRRRELLKQLGLSFKVIAPRIEEQPEKGEDPRHFAKRLAVDKARDVVRRLGDRKIVIAADTIVVLGKRILGKPKNTADARRMLRLLSGHWHKVVSGLCVMSRAKSASLVVGTDIEFKKLTREEVEFYVASGEPMDKAGAYAIQGIGSFMIRAIRGSYTNVVGLPVAELLDLLEKDFGLKWFA